MALEVWVRKHISIITYHSITQGFPRCRGNRYVEIKYLRKDKETYYKYNMIESSLTRHEIQKCAKSKEVINTY